MPGIILNMVTVDRKQFRGLGRTVAQTRKAALLELGHWWHATLFPKHFEPSNRREYQHEKRTPLYLQVIKRVQGVGQGKYIDQLLTGRSMRAMKVFYRVTATANKVTVRMLPPGYFTRPFIGSWTDPKTGQRKVITRQPNKPDEVTRHSPVDRNKISASLNGRFHRLYRQLLVSQATFTTDTRNA